MSNSKYLYLLLFAFVVFIGTNIYLLKLNSDISIDKYNLTSQVNSYKSETAFMRDYAIASSIDDGDLDSLKLLLSESASFQESGFESPKVVFQYKEGACSICLTKIYQDLSILSDVVGSENIIILTNSKVRDDIINPEKYGFEVYPITSSNLELEQFNEPFLFVVNADFEINYLYAPELFDEYRQYYFYDLLPKYFK